MRIKLDENIPVEVAITLRQLGHDVDTIPEEYLAGAPDEAVWQATQDENRFLITQDLDFSNVHQFKPGTHHGILLLRLNAPTRRSLIQRIEAVFNEEAVSDWIGCLIVATERRIRVRHPE